MFYTVNDEPLENAVVVNKTKAGGWQFSIFWNQIPKEVLRPDEINELLDWLDSHHIPRKECKSNAKTIATLNNLGEGYFVRKSSKNNKEFIEICGIVMMNNDLKFFRAGTTHTHDVDVVECWMIFQHILEQKVGKTLSQIFGGLPLSMLEYRKCVPSPINWASAYYSTRKKVAENCVKADICSAYGTEASKTLPDCRISKGKRVKGRVQPTEEFPFAFYLNSGHMAIYGEGSTQELAESGYITAEINWSKEEDDETLLLPAVDVSLRDVFEYLYKGRKLFADYKAVMNITIGMFHRKETKRVCDNLWPVAAVIKFRCNKRIIDACHYLEERGQHPILINTDSITWEGEWRDEFKEVFSEEKALGNFTLEYKSCRVIINGPKAYQVQDKETGETITRWSGPYSTKYTKLLGFGQIWNDRVKNMFQDVERLTKYQWDNKTHRFINYTGEKYQNIEQQLEEIVKWLKQEH